MAGFVLACLLVIYGLELVVDQTSILQIWKLAIVCLLQRQGGLVRITARELIEYNSEKYQIACTVVQDEQAIDIMLVTPEEYADYTERHQTN